MATSDHINLSTFIKSVHSHLREKSTFLGFERAWSQHCQDEQTLTKYAHAMKELATEHWQNNFSKSLKASSRVAWVYKYCLDYFIHSDSTDLIRQRERELKIANKMGIIIEKPYLLPSTSLELLDVGSCYNPFAEFSIFNVVAVDIAPAHPHVLKLDFLDVEIRNSLTEPHIRSNSFSCEYFDIIVFSLFLEYLPSPDLRIQSCEKAYKLLKYEGLLFIITPDSKHVGANAQFMKSWRFVLSKMGFSRIKYEKLPHIHCMAFRKCLDLRITRRWADLNEIKNVYDSIFIPQDFLEKQETAKKVVKSFQNSCEEFDYSSELPFCDVNLNEYV